MSAGCLGDVLGQSYGQWEQAAELTHLGGCCYEIVLGFAHDNNIKYISQSHFDGLKAAFSFLI